MRYVVTLCTALGVLLSLSTGKAHPPYANPAIVMKPSQEVFRVSIMEGEAYEKLGDVAVASNGDVFASVPEAGKIKVFDSGGNPVREIDGIGIPWGLGFDDEGFLYIADASRPSRIVVLTSDGEPIREIGMPYPDDEYMELFTKTDLEPEAHDIAVASDGRIFVTDIMLCRVLVFSDAGDLLGSFGGPGARPGELSWPGCLAISDKDEVHVCNSLNTRIEVFDLAGSFIRSYGQSRSFIGNLVVPLGIAFDKKGRAIVTENRMGALQYFGPSAEDSGLWEYKFHMADEVVELDELSKQRPVTSFYAQGGVAVFPDGETVVFRLQNGELMARRLTETTSNQEDQPDKP